MFKVIYDGGSYETRSFNEAVWICGILNFLELNAVILDRHGDYVQ